MVIFFGIQVKVQERKNCKSSSTWGCSGVIDLEHKDMESFDGGWLFPFYSPLKWEALLWVNQLMKHTIFVLSRKLTARPWKSILVQMTFPFKEAYFLRLCYKVADLCATVVVCTRLLCRAALNWLRLAGTSTQCLSRTRERSLAIYHYDIQFMYVFTYIDFMNISARIYLCIQ